MRAVLLPVVAVVLAACQTIPLERQVILVCDKYYDTLLVVTALNTEGRLSDRQVATISQTIPIANGICLDGEVTDFRQALDRMEEVLLDLLIVELGTENDT